MSDKIKSIYEQALSELDGWTNGSRSWVNLGPNAPYTPDVIAAMDAQEVVKWAAVVAALRPLVIAAAIEDSNPAAGTP